MLVLARNIGDSIQIGENVEITVLSVKGKTVRVGINAPHDLSVHRSEIYIRANSPSLLSAKPIRGNSLADTLDE